MSPTPSPPPAVLLPQLCHLPHAFVTVSLISEKLEKKCASESFISKHVVQTHLKFKLALYRNH